MRYSDHGDIDERCVPDDGHLRSSAHQRSRGEQQSAWRRGRGRTNSIRKGQARAHSEHHALRVEAEVVREGDRRAVARAMIAVLQPGAPEQRVRALEMHR